MESRRLAIEIGGTKLQLGVGDGISGQLDALVRCDVDPAHGARGILAAIDLEGRALLAAHAVDRIGIGFGGPVQSGIVTTSHQIAGWDHFPIADWCRERFGLPVVVANDCDAAALAEARFGAGRSARTVFFVTVGTGVGGGLVIDGRLHGAGRPAVAEIGHLRPGFAATSAESTVESLASGWGMANIARRIWKAKHERIPNAPDVVALREWCADDRHSLTARHVAEFAERGNSLAQRALRESLTALGWAIAQVITLVAPEVVVVGGGVSLIGEAHFFAPLREIVAGYVFPPLAESYRVAPAELGEEVVVIGGLLLAARSTIVDIDRLGRG